MIDLLLRDVVTFGATDRVSVAVDDGRILAVGADLDYAARMEVEGQGHYLSPGFVESHLHLDIALSNDAGQPGRPEAFVSMAGLNAAIESRRRSFTHEEIVRRASAALELGLGHGTTALRAQCHLDMEIGLRHIEALEEALGRKAEKNFLPLQDGDVPATYADTAELHAATGFAPATPVREGVRRFVEWYRGYHRL